MPAGILPSKLHSSLIATTLTHLCILLCRTTTQFIELPHNYYNSGCLLPLPSNPPNMFTVLADTDACMSQKCVIKIMRIDELMPHSAIFDEVCLSLRILILYIIRPGIEVCTHTLIHNEIPYYCIYTYDSMKSVNYVYTVSDIFNYTCPGT